MDICIIPKPLSPHRGEYSICRCLAQRCASFVKGPRLKYRLLARDWQTCVAQASVRDLQENRWICTPDPISSTSRSKTVLAALAGYWTKVQRSPHRSMCTEDQLSHFSPQHVRIHRPVGGLRDVSHNSWTRGVALLKHRSREPRIPHCTKALQ